MEQLFIEAARIHAAACTVLLDAGKLAEALVYCDGQRVDPPECSLTAESPNALRLRALAMNHLTDKAWWRKRLAVVAKRDAERKRMQLQQKG